MIIKPEAVNINNVKDKYFEMQKNKYFYLSLTLATISIFIIFAIRPTILQAIEAYKNLQELEEVESKLEVKEQQLKDADILVSENSESIQLLEKAIPSDTNESIFLSNLNESAFNNQVILDGISFIQKTNSNNAQDDIPTDYKFIEFTASYDAKYTDLQSFIREVNEYLRLTQIMNISIEQNASLKGTRVKGKLIGRIYYK